MNQSHSFPIDDPLDGDTLHEECGVFGILGHDVLALDGEIDHRDVFLSEYEKQENTRLCACVSRVVGSVTLDSSYRPDMVG